jgi:hypothetical protein
MATSSPTDFTSPHRRSAKDLLRACRAQDPDALRRYGAVWQDPKPPSLQRCQHVIAKEHGANDWDDLTQRSRLLTTLVSPAGSFTHAIVTRADATDLSRALSDPTVANTVLGNLNQHIHLNSTSRQVIDEWYRRRGFTLTDDDLARVQQLVNTSAPATIDQHAWAAMRLQGSLRTFAMSTPAWMDADEADAFPFALPLGFGCWAGGYANKDDLHQMSISPGLEPYWRSMLTSGMRAASDEQAPLKRHADPGKAITAHWKAVAVWLRSHPVGAFEHLAAAAEIQGAPKRHAITMPWRREVQGDLDGVKRPSWSSRALLVSGNPGSGKTVWLRFLLEQMSETPALIFDRTGDLPGKRLSPHDLDLWADGGAGHAVLDVPEWAQLPTSIPRFERPTLVVLHGVHCPDPEGIRDDDVDAITHWIRTTRHVNGDRVLFVICGQVSPFDFREGLFTDHLAFRHTQREPWPDLAPHLSPKHLAQLPVGCGWLLTAEGRLFLLDSSHQLTQRGDQGSPDVDGKP